MRIKQILLTTLIIGLLATGVFVADALKQSTVSEGGMVGYWTLNESDLYSGTTVFQDMSGNGNNGTSAETPSYTSDQNGVPSQSMTFNGSSDYITIGDIGNIKSFSTWIYPTANTKSIADFDGGTISAEIDNANNITATGWTSPTIYVNGIASDDITLNAWNFITITSDTNVDADTLILGKEASYYTGYLSDIAIYSSALTADEVSQLYKAGRTTARMKVDAEDIINGWDLTSGWSAWLGGSAVDATSFISDANGGGIYDPGTLTEGRKYKIVFEGSLDGGQISVGMNGVEDILSLSGTTPFSRTATFIGDSNGQLGLYNNGDTKTTTITRMEIVDITNAVTPKLQKGLILDMPLNDRYTEAGADITITDIDGDGTDATATATAHGLTVGNIVYISGSTNYNGKHNVKTVADANTFTFDTTSSTTNESGTGKRLDGTTKDRTPYSNDGTVSGATLKHDGLVNTGDGIAYINQDKAYGTWEFDVNKGADGNIIYLPFISDRAGGGIDPLGYLIYINTDEAIWLRRTNAGSATSLFATANSYITINTDYRIKITRSLAGVFTMYIKGGAYGWDDWTTVGTGTDNTYTISNYLVADIESGDTVSNLKIDGKRISLANAVQSTGTWIKTGGAYDFDGTDDLITIGNVGTTAKTLSFWVNLDSTTESILEETDDVGVSVSTGTMSYGSWDNCFIDGVDTDTITTGFHSVILTSTTNVDVSALRLGLVNTTYLDGQISGLKVFNRELSSGDVEYLYSKEKVNY